MQSPTKPVLCGSVKMDQMTTCAPFLAEDCSATRWQ